MFFLQSSAGPGLINLLFFASIFMIMYFFFLRPQVKKQKAQDAFVKEMEKGDEVVTTSGIIGRINKIENGVVQLQIDQKTFIRVVQGAISKEMTESLNKPEGDKS
jgi:preprotein translocase subunit YajC